MPSDTWNPAQYERFKRERSQPFFDLLATVRPKPGMKIVDLGCGTGEWTRHIHVALEAQSTLGVDLSDAMLERTKALAPAPISPSPRQTSQRGPPHKPAAPMTSSSPTPPSTGSQSKKSSSLR